MCKNKLYRYGPEVCPDIGKILQLPLDKHYIDNTRGASQIGSRDALECFSNGALQSLLDCSLIGSKA